MKNDLICHKVTYRTSVSSRLAISKRLPNIVVRVRDPKKSERKKSQIIIQLKLHFKKEIYFELQRIEKKNKYRSIEHKFFSF